MSPLVTALSAAGCLAIACALLSVIVVLRRWAFAAEGIGHSGFGGAGCAWLLASALPVMNQAWIVYVAVMVFCILTALAIGRLSRVGRVSADAAVGVFLVASLAFGFVAQQVYHRRWNASPAGFDVLLFGNMGTLSVQFSVAAMAMSALVVAVLVAMSKEVIAYSFDPLAARTSGVRSDLVHDVLMILLAIVIVIGSRIAGSVLVVAPLVLPGATALMLSPRLGLVIGWSIAIALSGAAGGIITNHLLPVIPTGPAIVLILFLQFVGGWACASRHGRT